MKISRQITLAALTLLLMFGSTAGPTVGAQASTDPPADAEESTQQSTQESALASVQAEIQYLLDFVEISGCEFYRNGSWYHSQQAREHLQAKLEYLSARKRIHTAEDFIQLAASKSSMSGKPYEIRCGKCTASAASSWLAGVLSRYRSLQAREQQSA